MSEKKGQNFLHGAVIYTLGIIMVKILGAVYKIPLGNILGDDGFWHFDMTYKIYNVFLTISTAGIPVAMSRMISEADALDRDNQVHAIFRTGVATFLGMGAVGTILMMLFPVQMASRMGDEQAALSVFIMAPSVVLVCVTAAYRGYAQGHSDMIPTTVSQVIETAVKVLVGLTCASWLRKHGYGVAVCAAGAILGTTVSSVAAMLYMHIKVHRKYRVKPGPEAKDVPEKRRKILWDLLRIGIPITLSTSVMSLIQLADSGITLNQLQHSAGFAYEEALTMGGVYGKAMTIYNVPSALVIPFLSTVVPAISAARIRKNSTEVCNIAESSMRMCTLLCLPMAVGMAVLSGPCMDVLYPQSSQQGAMLLLELGIVCYFMTMSLMTNSILPANGNERLPLVAILLGAIAKIVVTYLLVGNPAVNIYGAPIGTLCCYLVMLTVNLVNMARHMERPMNLWNIAGRSGISCAAMGVTAYGVWRGLHAAMANTMGTIAGRQINILLPFAAAVGAGVLVYGVMIIALRAITLEDMKLLPHGEKIARLLHIR